MFDTKISIVVRENLATWQKDGLDQVAQEICGRLARHLFVQLDEGELRGPVDCDDEMELGCVL